MVVHAEVYELRVAGPVTPELLDALGACAVAVEPPLTVLHTEPTDQSGLHGLLRQVRALGLELFEVRVTAAVSEDSADGADPQEAGW